MEPSHEIGLDVRDLRHMLAAIGLTRIASETYCGTGAWNEAGAADPAFKLYGTGEDFALRCARWFEVHWDAFEFADLKNVKDVSPELWSEEADRSNGQTGETASLRRALWASVGSDGVPHGIRSKPDWSRIEASRFEFAAGAGHVHWLQSMRLLARGAAPNGDEGVEAARKEIARVLNGAIYDTQGEQDVRSSAHQTGPRPKPVAQCRWDPACDRSHARLARRPADDKLHQDDTISALAVAGFASMASAPTARGLATPSFDVGGERSALTWPVWTTPMGIEALEAMLATGPRAWRGWTTVRARRRTAGKGAFLFDRGVIANLE